MNMRAIEKSVLPIKITLCARILLQSNRMNGIARDVETRVTVFKTVSRLSYAVSMTLCESGLSLVPLKTRKISKKKVPLTRNID